MAYSAFSGLLGGGGVGTGMTFPHVVAMRAGATPTIAGTTAYLQGYFAPGDGGGGYFVWTTVTGSDNGGTFILPAGAAGTGVWRRYETIAGLFQGVDINVKWFGAKGDNTNDDTAEIQSAVDFAVSRATNTSQPYIVRFPAGNYLVSATINLCGTAGTYANGFNVVGATGATSAIHGVVNGGYILRRNINSTFGGPHVISDLTVSNDSTGTTGGTVSLCGFVGLTVKNCHFQGRGVLLNFAETGAVDAQNNSFQKTISGCVFTCPVNTNDGTNTASIGIQSKAHTTIQGCDFSNFVHGVRLYGTQMSITGARFENCVNAMTLGNNNTGGSFLLDRGFFGSISGEDNYVFINNQGSHSTLFAGCTASGGAGGNVFTGQSLKAVFDNLGGQTTYSSCQWMGSFSDSTVHVRAYNSLWINCEAQNGFNAKPAWKFDFVQDSGTIPYQKQFINCLSYTGGWDGTLGDLPVYPKIRAVSGTSDTLKDEDDQMLVTYNNANPVAVTLPSIPNFSAARQIYLYNKNWSVNVNNIGAGTVTITPTTVHIDGQTSITLAQFKGCKIFSDGANYFTSGR